MGLGLTTSSCLAFFSLHFPRHPNDKGVGSLFNRQIEHYPSSGFFLGREGGHRSCIFFGKGCQFITAVLSSAFYVRFPPRLILLLTGDGVLRMTRT